MTRPHCLLQRWQPALVFATTLSFALSGLAAASAPANPGKRPGGAVNAATNAFVTNGISQATHPKFRLPTREDLQRQEQVPVPIGAGTTGSFSRRKSMPPPLDPDQRAQLQQQVDAFLAQRERETPPAPASPQVVERGPHHNRWETYRTTLNASGRREVRTNSYVELATGLNRAAGDEWVPAKALVELAPGGAVATQGAHKAKFGANANRAGFLELVTPEGRQMKSHVLGLFYLETTTGKSAQVTGLKDSPGAIHPPNMVVYADAFKDLKADLRYTYKLHGLEQDVILRERPPSPADFGFDPEETELVVLTEFVAAPEPVRTGRVLKRKVRQGQAADGLADETLEFGAMMMGLGKAFQLGDQGRPALDKAGSPISVGKRWLKKDGRVFLLESVEYPDLKPHLPQLPPRPEARNRQPAMPLESMVAAFDAPPARTEPFHGRMQVASLPLTGPGLVVDYDLVTTTTNFTFQSGTTYCVSNSVYLSGTTTIEGGAVVKFATNVGWIAVQNTLSLKTSEYAPAVFTAMDDDLVGETISGSTGAPSGYYAYCTLYFNGASTMDLELRHLRIRHCSMAAYSTLTGSALVRDVQIDHCGTYGLYFDANTSALTVYNSLITRQLYGIVSSATNVQIVNCTFDQGSAIVWINGNGGTHFTNNIVASSGLGLAPNPTAANNVVYNGSISQLGATVSVNPFQVAGGGAYYLSEAGGCRNAGTTNLDQAIKDVLARRTTEAPQTVGGSLSGNVVFGKRVARDTDTPDLGYHYAPLDYVFAGCALQSGAKLQVKIGTCIGVVNTNTTNSLPGIELNPGGGTVEFVSAGRPNDPNRWVLFNSVQEAGSTNWNQNVSDLINSSDGGDIQGECRFNEFVVLGKTSIGSYQCYATSPNGALAFNHCRFNGGYFGLGGHDTALFSCLLENVAMGGTPYGSTNSLVNCTLHRGTVTLAGSGTGGSVGVFDTLFAKTSLTQGTNVYHHHNGYDTNYSRLTPAQGTDVELNGVSFVEGAMGGFYLPSGSSLNNAGSRSATNAGLSYFTTGTNQSQEASSTVDIGFHYLALNGSGQPVDTDGDGLPDYVEDENGDGALQTGETSPTTAYTLLPSLHDSLVDFDYDGASALKEYQLGTDPHYAGDYVPASSLLGRWRFDTSALTGDQGQVPRFTNNVSLASSWNTNAVLLSGSNTLTRLLNVDYGNDSDTNYHKWGIAAYGLTTDDYWYPYIHPWSTDVTVTNLLWSDQAALPTGAKLRVQNAPGLWGSETGDKMYNGYVYDWNGAGISSTYTGLPPGLYELHLYGHGADNNQNSSFSAFTSTRDFGSRATLNTNTWNTNIWVEGVQFVKFTNVTLLAEQALQINAIKVASAYTCINGMQLANRVASQLAYREVETNGVQNIYLKRGTAMFWVKPDWTSGTGPGHEGRLLEVGDHGSTNGWWALYCSTNGSELKFAGKSGTNTASYFTCPIGWSNVWIHVALTYTETNSVLYLNGAQATNGAGVTLVPDVTMRFMSGLNIGGDVSGWNNLRGQMDELEIYNYPLSASEISSTYNTLASRDTDGDGLTDRFENQYGLNHLVATDTRDDSDYDGRTLLQEQTENTDPRSGTSMAKVRLGRWRFDTDAFLGEQGQVPESIYGVSNVLSWDGQALRSVDPSGSRRLAYRDVETNGNANINCRQGSVSFWFRPAWSSTNLGGTGPGSWGRLIELGQYTDPPTYGNWQVHLNPWGTELLFYSATNGGASVYLSPTVSLISNY